MVQRRAQRGDKPDDLDRARSREAALRDVLQLISHSQADEAPVFDVILNRVTDLCGADAAAMILAKADDTRQRGVAYSGVNPATTALLERGEVPMHPEFSSSRRRS